jgi:hypothetical protein
MPENPQRRGAGERQQTKDGAAGKFLIWTPPKWRKKEKKGNLISLF